MQTSAWSLLFTCLCALSLVNASPLASSSWPTSHNNIQATDATTAQSIDFTREIQQTFIRSFNVVDLADPITLVTVPNAEDKDVLNIWGSGVTGTGYFHYNKATREFKNLDVFHRPGPKSKFHGAYCFATADNAFYAGFKKRIDRYIVNADNKIERTHMYQVLDDDTEDNIVGLVLLKDGHIMVNSKQGILRAVKVDLSAIVATFDIKQAVGDAVPHISNSFAGDESSVYIVTQRDLVRINWDAPTKTYSLAWSTRYYHLEGTVPQFPQRLGPGSGSTPSVTTCKGEKYIVITDGELPMHLSYYHAETGKLEATTLVSFRADNSPHQTTSEQSVAVHECSAFVVNNFIAESIDTMPTYISRTVCAQISDSYRRHVCPTALGFASHGAARFDFNPTSSSIERVWTNEDVSCGTSIPVISTTSKQALCFGKADPSWGVFSWGVMGLNFDNGTLELSEKLSSSYMYFDQNPLFANTEIIADGVIVSGTLGGISMLTGEPLDRNAQPSATDATSDHDEL